MQEKYIDIKSLKVSSDLVQFVKDELLKETEISPENFWAGFEKTVNELACLLYTSPSPRDRQKSRMPSSA